MERPGNPSVADPRAVRAAVLVAAATIAQLVAAKATRDTLFLTRFDVTGLPNMVLAGAVLSLFAVFPLARGMTVLGPARFVPLLFLGSGLALGAEWLLYRVAPAATVVLVFLHVAALGPTLVSGFWSLINERFDPRTARRKISRIVTGSTLGGLAGGILAERLGSTLGAVHVLPILGVLHLYCALQLRDLRSPTPAASPESAGNSRQSSSKESTNEEPETEPLADASLGGEAIESWQARGANLTAGLRTIRRSPYLSRLSRFMILLTISAGLLDYAFKVKASEWFAGSNEQQLLRFFAIFYTASGLLTFLVQSLLSRRLLDRVGLTRVILFDPAAAIVGVMGALLLPGLASITAARGLVSVMRSSIFRSGYELLYTPVSPTEKRQSKALIDVGADRLGDGLAALLIKGLLFVPGGFAHSALVIAAGICAAAGMWIARRLGTGYVQALEKSMLDRAVELRLDQVHDSTTRSIVLNTMTGFKRADLLAALEKHRQGVPLDAPSKRATPPLLQPAPDAAAIHQGTGEKAEAKTHGGDAASQPASETAAPPRGIDRYHADSPSGSPLLERIRTLGSGSPEAIRSLLNGMTMLDVHLVSHVIPLLASDSLSEDAIRALRTAAPRATGQLVDALLDPDTEFAVRRRLPRVLAAFPNSRGVAGLVAALSDRRFEVRYQSGRALSLVRRRHPELPIDTNLVLEATLRDLRVDRPIWESRRLLDQGMAEPTSVESTAVDEWLTDRTNRSLEHVFTLLALLFEPEPLRIAYRGLHANDPHLRGTALEYLESILPVSVRDLLWPLLEDTSGRSKGPTRSRQEVLEDLLQSNRSIAIRLDELGGSPGSKNDS